MTRAFLIAFLVASCLIAACSNDNDGDNNGTGGAAATGGATTTGGNAGTAGAVAEGGAAGTGGGPIDVFPAGVTVPKIMIVGDSISAGPGCYKGHLKDALEANGHSFEFVGAYTDDCGDGVMHSAVSCATAAQFTQETFTVDAGCFSGTQPIAGMAALVATHSPDLVMIQLGVNDIWGGGGSVAGVLGSYETLIEQARAHNPSVVAVVAQIHKIVTTSDDCTQSPDAKAQELVEAVPAWAEEVSTAESPVFVADLWTNSDPTESNDCVHPNAAGAERMGGNWYEALKNLIPKS